MAKTSTGMQTFTAYYEDHIKNNNTAFIGHTFFFFSTFKEGVEGLNHEGCVRLASLGRPRSAPGASTSFDVIPGAQPQVPCLWTGSLGAGTRCMTKPGEVE